LNTQKKIPASVIRESSDLIDRVLHFKCETRDKPSQEPITDAIRALAQTNVASVVVVGDVPGYPPLLLAPERRWALVNISALTEDSPSPSLLAERTRKEMLRGFGFLMGAANSNFDVCLMKSVFSVQDLDALSAKFISIEILNKILKQAQKMGIKPPHMTTYRKAVEEGWAPAPTNDIQRAVWNELKK
jgi:predicted Zn-dependent protease